MNPPRRQRFTIETIHIGERLRPLDQKAVEQIAASIRESGLLHPPTLRFVDEMEIDGELAASVPVLISGRHRLEALKLNGIDEVECLVMDISEAAAELVEIDENLARKDLSDAERGYQLARRKVLWEQLHPETKHGAIGNGRKKSRKICDSKDYVADFHEPAEHKKPSEQGSAAPPSADRFTKTVADITGRGERIIQQEIRRATQIGDDIARVVGTSLDKGVELDALAKLPEPERKDLIDRAAAGEKVSARRRREAPDSSHLAHAADQFLDAVIAEQFAEAIAFAEEIKLSDIVAALRRRMAG